jgi:GT2 family glycosyltransferase
MISESGCAAFSVVVVSLNEGPSLRRTVDNLRTTTPARAEVVIVDDGSDDHSADFAQYAEGIQLYRTSGLGVAAARNFGARHTTGEYIVFADAHIEVADGWWTPILHVLTNPAVGAAAPAIAVAGDITQRGFGLRFGGPHLEIEWLDQRGPEPYAVPIVPGCCLAMRRDVFEATGGFDEGMIRSGSVDNELALRFWLLGYELRIVPQVTVIHAFRDQHPYEITWATVLHNKLRLALVHFAPDRFERVKRSLAGHHGFEAGLALAEASNARSRRRDLVGRRLRDDEWFFERFGVGMPDCWGAGAVRVYDA